MPAATLDSPRVSRSDESAADEVVRGYPLLAALIDMTPEALRKALGSPQGPDDWPSDWPKCWPTPAGSQDSGPAWPQPLHWDGTEPVLNRMQWLLAMRDRGVLRPVEQRLADKKTKIIGYDAAGAVAGGRAGQSMRKLMSLRRKRIAEEGKARANDMLEPVDWVGPAHKAQPVYQLGPWMRWAMQTNRLKFDGITPDEIPRAGRRGNRRA